MDSDYKKIESSFRDPNGFLFEKQGVLYRAVTSKYKTNYDMANQSGLYESLISDNSLIKHEEEDLDKFLDLGDFYKILRPEYISFLSYPYEWSFNQLKDAALLTLEIQKKSLERGMILKDASAYNVQFKNGKPIFIDTLSFEEYKEGEPWVAYKQFCQHFLAPLALMSYRDLRFGGLSRLYIDGVPLDLASSILPWRTYLRPVLSSHIHLHARSQKKYSNDRRQVKIKISKIRLFALIDSLESVIKSLEPKQQKTEWQNYYNETNYSSESFTEKKRIISEFLGQINPSSVWDLGGNTGIFSRLASKKGIKTVSFDIDPIAVDINYVKSKEDRTKNILPLVLDLTNPSPSIGWAEKERDSLSQRGPTDTILALALIHHLAISNNLPFDKIAQYFSQLSKNIIIEFVPKSDSQVQKLLSTREDIFPNYTKEDFQKSFEKYFLIKKEEKVSGSERVLYFMSKK